MLMQSMNAGQDRKKQSLTTGNNLQSKMLLLMVFELQQHSSIGKSTFDAPYHDCVVNEYNFFSKTETKNKYITNK